MKKTFRHLVCALFAVAATACLAAPAQAQSHVWGQDGWCYVVQGTHAVRTTISRRFPDPRNPNVYDIFDNGRFVRRVGVTVSAPRPTQAPVATRRQTQPPVVTQRQTADEIRLVQLINQLNQLNAAARAQAAAGAGQVRAGAPGTIGGFSGSDSFLPGSTVNVGGRATDGAVIFGMTGGNFRSPFLDPACKASSRGCF